jgi:hypothetical protein
MHQTGKVLITELHCSEVSAGLEDDLFILGE